MNAYFVAQAIVFQHAGSDCVVPEEVAQGHGAAVGLLAVKGLPEHLVLAGRTQATTMRELLKVSEKQTEVQRDQI